MPRHYRILALSLLLTLAGSAGAQPPAATRTWPLTRPEATNYAETSRYDDVVGFMTAMAAASPRIHLTTCGYTFEGRPMPLAVVAARPDGQMDHVRGVVGGVEAGGVHGRATLELRPSQRQIEAGLNQRA